MAEEYKCSKVLSMLDSYLNNVLDINEVERIDGHLSGCSSCMAELELRREQSEHLEDHFLKSPFKYEDLTVEFTPSFKITKDIK